MENPTPGVTTPEKSPDEIEREMTQTREAITEKVAALETQVIGTVQAVTGTVESVKEAITAAPTAVKETVKGTVQAVKETVGSFSVTECVQTYPWAAVGTTAAAGFVAGYLLGGGRHLRSRMAPIARMQAAVPESTAAESGKSGGFLDSFFGELFRTAGKELRQVAETAVAAASSALKQAVSTGVPKLVDSAVPEVPPRPHNGPGYTPRMSEGSGV
ncbi:MAG TPA: hypothetical protein VKE74_33470 [Gemmataceae bacterium]|nr:hypothetical protein [Gemmataceae bacterium]